MQNVHRSKSSILGIRLRKFQYLLILVFQSFPLEDKPFLRWQVVRSLLHALIFFKSRVSFDLSAGAYDGVRHQGPGSGGMHCRGVLILADLAFVDFMASEFLWYPAALESGNDPRAALFDALPAHVLHGHYEAIILAQVFVRAFHLVSRSGSLFDVQRRVTRTPELKVTIRKFVVSASICHAPFSELQAVVLLGIRRHPVLLLK